MDKIYTSRKFYRFWIILVTCEVLCRVTATMQSGVFKEIAVCGVKERLAQNCIQLASLSRMSRGSCAALCYQNSTSCLGVVVDDSGSCYLHYDCGDLDAIAACTEEDAAFTAYRHDRPTSWTPPCQNGGVWLETVQRCLCGPYASGVHCEDLPVSCMQLREWGLPFGRHTARMNFLNHSVAAATVVTCEIGADFVHTFVSHSNGTSDDDDDDNNNAYNATFQEYVDGFHKGEAAFWLGLDNLHALTDAGVDDLVVVLVLGGVKVVRKYHRFEVDDASDDYEVDFVGWTLVSNSLGVSIGRCLTSDAPFSAWDRDNDRETSINLASEAGTGWWFDRNNDRFCNLNGLKPSDDSAKLSYVTVDMIDMSLRGHGGDFESLTLYLEQGYP